jgi:hypothetical protein
LKAERLAAQKDNQKDKEAKVNKAKPQGQLEKLKPVRAGVGKYISGGLL